MIQYHEPGSTAPISISEPEAIQRVRDILAQTGVQYPALCDPDYHMLLDFVAIHWAWQVEPIIPVGRREIRLDKVEA